MIQEIIVTSLAFFFSPSPIAHPFLLEQSTPLQQTFGGAFENIQNNVENLSNLNILQNSLIASLSTEEMELSEEQKNLVVYVEQDIQKNYENGEREKAVALDTSLDSLLRAYGIFKGTPNEMNYIQEENEVVSSSTIAYTKQEVTDHLLTVRSLFVGSLETLTDQEIERVESELMLVEQMLLEVNIEGGYEALSLLKMIDQYIYHATFLIRDTDFA